MSTASRFAAGFAILALTAACSGSSDNGGGSGGASGSAGAAGASGGATQVGWWCTCDGNLYVGQPMTTQAEAETACVDYCATSGGTPSVRPKLSLEGTPECDAFCAKADSLGCPGTPCAERAEFWCGVGAESCVEAEKAQLKCKAETGTFECDADSWKRSSSCGLFSELCQ